MLSNTLKSWIKKPSFLSFHNIYIPQEIKSSLEIQRLVTHELVFTAVCTLTLATMMAIQVLEYNYCVTFGEL